ncbi:RNA polymerase II transcriptional coactivator KELP [Sesamum alatum]|uniref:RNA polymerase II transcriptional coactivator KELP n=1 Tax=Sesamum alatum TaxID=300844 RepID=A0AAE2CDV5_9LAMI|nr:RNA polymerase II transcriptional coactivator KELP [Sesamum alatum]
MEEECLNASKRRKIEDTVLQILKASDLETTTELDVRAAAAERLGFGLSGVGHRRLVRQLVDSFLLSTAASILGTTPLHSYNDDDSAERRDKLQQQQLRGVGDGLQGNYNGKVICKLTDKRMVTIHDINGQNMVLDPGFLRVNSGVSLTPTQWSSFKASFPSIQEAIVKLESRLRSEAVEKQKKSDMTNSLTESAADNSQTEAGISKSSFVSEAEMAIAMADSAAEKSQTQAGISNLTTIVHSPVERKQTEADTSWSVTAPSLQEHILAERKQGADTSGTIAISTSQEQIPAERKQTEADVSTSVRAFPTQGRSYDRVTAVCPERLVCAERKQAEADFSTLVPVIPTEGQLHDTVSAVHPEPLVPAERKQTEADVSTSLPAFPNQGHLHHTLNAVRSEQVIPIQTVRLDGRNYNLWRHQIELFLNQLDIGYVLAKPCPRVSLNPETSLDEKVKEKAAVQRWINDDYMCRHNILNSLCDNLFQLYSQKSCSARELWEELQLVYGEELGTRRSQINKYIHFQMVDGVSILEQVQELHRIANSIMASGTWIDENFHVSTIVSKLPPSWKEFRVRLKHEEFLPFNMLMHRLQVEEDSRNCFKIETNYNKGHIIEPKLDCRLGMRRKENKRVCYSCGKEGHIIKNCPNRKFESGGKINEKENGALSPDTDNKVGDIATTK